MPATVYPSSPVRFALLAVLVAAASGCSSVGPMAEGGANSARLSEAPGTAASPATAQAQAGADTMVPPDSLRGFSPGSAVETPPMPATTSVAAAPQDLWQRIRGGMAIPLPGGPALQRMEAHRRWYAARAGHLRSTFTRARLYLFDIVEAVERERMPLEIALLPAVESAYLPTAHSPAAADGIWQFIAPTARRFDLKQHMFQDDRRNVRAATQAALRYLNELQQRYGGDYQLALAAYNCGEGCIDKAVREARARGLPGRYEDLQLNDETAQYVPRLLALSQQVAAAVDAGNLAQANLPPMANAAYFVGIPIQRDIDVELAASLAEMSLADFKALNAQHKKPVIVAAANAEVLVPVEREAAFREALARYRGPLATWAAAKVPQRSSVEVLARQHGVPPAVLRDVNQIPPGHLVSAGSTVVVPRQQPERDISAGEANAAKMATVPAMVAAPVQVLRKDTWAALAARLDVAPQALRQWNPQLKQLRRGQMRLTLPIAVAEHAARLPQVVEPAVPAKGKHGNTKPKGQGQGRKHR